MIHTDYTVRTLKVVSLIVGSALFLWSMGLPSQLRLAAANAELITSASDTLSNSTPSNGSVHAIGFTTDNGLNIGQTIVISFPSSPGGGFDLTGLDADDITMTVGGFATTTSSSGSGAGTWGVATGTPTSQDITLTTPTDVGVASSTAISITIGGSASTTIINPSATTSYGINIGGTMTDHGVVRVTIIDEVTMSGNVDTSLLFAITAVGSGNSVNGTTTNGTSTNVTLPFGTLNLDVIYTLAQKLNVATNASNGYSVAVYQSGDLQSDSGGVIDGFADGSNVATPQAWVGPSEDIGDNTTWGHWGLTSDDATTTRSAEFSVDQWVSGSTTPIVVMGHTGTSNGIVDGIGSTTVGYQLEITSLQEAGDDYETTLRYVATPIF